MSAYEFYLKVNSKAISDYGKTLEDPKLDKEKLNHLEY